MYLLVMMIPASISQAPGAEQWNKKSVLTVEQPFEFPGIALVRDERIQTARRKSQ